MTSIMDFLRLWQEAYDAAAASATDEEASRHSDRYTEIEAAMMAVPAATVQDLAAKLLVSTSYGDFAVGDALIAEAKALVGSGWDTHR